ncbi:nuclear transcription factor Y subunit gamma-like isoform X1 [Oppia nitens]|uniref:nuclear transcription factor Y subunit gamma-like isoform X1 n=1 Tax=Oppia nitens TaxID=1686743 RepID=UPI0023DA476F|nr:nuclear transcription factor Y subunit gamma-like isoform X1 [Oppia nitens]
MSDGYNHSVDTNVANNSEAQQMLDNFWHREIDNIKNLGLNDFKNQELPLARIKKIMKLDEDVKMISAEAPVLFAKAAEIFITEISLRAWIHTEDNKRRTLQRNDIAMAITKYDQFDFLIDIVPRDELKPTKRQDNETLRSAVATTQVPPDQVQYYLQLAQQHNQALQHQGQPTQQIQILQTGTAPGGQPQFTVSPQLVQVQMPTNANNAGGDGQNVTASASPQVLQISAPNASANTQQKAGIQFIQQLVQTNGGELVQQQIPIQLSAQQIQALLQSQTGGQAGTNQPIILTSPLQQAVSLPQYQIATSGGTQYLQTVVSGAATNVTTGLTAHQTDINSSPQLDEESNET